MRGIVLAAGLGTRLQPLTHHRPKPLVPIVGRPLIDFALSALAAIGVDEVGVNAFHLGPQLDDALRGRPGRWVVVHEETLQGTGGGVRDLSRALGGGPLAVINGDALFDFDLAPLRAAHEASGALATLVLREVPADAPFGRVGVDAAGRLHRIAEVTGPDAAQAELRYGAFTGVQFVEPALVSAIPAGPGDILRTAYRRRLDERALLRGVFVPADAVWLDVGTVERYLDANRAVLRGILPGAPGVRIHPTAQIHPSATVSPAGCVIERDVAIGAGAQIGPDVWLGAGAVVAPGGVVRDAVVWPRARVDGALVGGVALP